MRGGPLIRTGFIETAENYLNGLSANYDEYSIVCSQASAKLTMITPTDFCNLTSYKEGLEI